MIRPLSLGGGITLLVGLLSGCGPSRTPAFQKLPPLPAFPPGVYVDVNPRWSHDGRQIAFLRATPDRRMQLTLVDSALRRPRALLPAEPLGFDRPYSSDLCRYCSPETLAWSPDDRLLAFERAEWFVFADGEHLPGTELWAWDQRSGHLMPLAQHPNRYDEGLFYYHTPQWSPDGRALAFVGEGLHGERAILIRTLHAQSSEHPRRLYDSATDSDWPAWEPQGSVANGGHRRVFGLAFQRTIRRSPFAPPTETLRRVVPGAVRGGGLLWRLPTARYAGLLGETADPNRIVVPRAGHLAWSPDGRTLAFTLTPDARDYTRYELWTIRRDGREARRVCAAGGRGYVAPVWIGAGALGALSPVGTRFAVTVIRLRDGVVRTLGIIDSADCDWSPDRSQIVYAEPVRETPPAPLHATTLCLFPTHLTIPARGDRPS